MANIADLVVSLSADIASFRSGMAEANQHLSDLKKQSSDTGGALQSLQQGLEGFITVETLRRAADFGASLVESAAQIGHLSQALGVSTGAYQALGYAAAQAGVPADSFAGIMEKLSKNLEVMATGASSPAKVFSDLGLAATNADGSVRSAANTLEDLAKNKIFLAENATTQLGQIMTITGARMGDATLIVNALKNGTLDLAAAQKLAQQEGAAYSDETIADAEDLEKRVSAAWQKIKVSIGTAVIYAAEHPLDFIFNPMAGMESTSPEGGQTQHGASDDWKPPGAAVVDPTRTKELQSFQETYQKLLQTEQEDANYQAELRVAYQQGAAAVAQVAAAHAADKAQLELLEAAQRDHVTATQAEISAVREAAAANAINTKAAAEQKQVTDALAASQKKQDDELQKLVQSSTGLNAKQNELAQTEGLLWQAVDRGIIPLQQAEAAIAQLQKQLNDFDNKGMKEFTSGLSSDLDTAIGKMTDFSAMIEEKQKTKGKDSIFAQLEQDANEFTASLEKLLLKLLIINPLLNSLGLGDQGNGKSLPTLYGNSAFTGNGTSGLSGFLERIFGFGGASTASTAADASLNSEAVDALTTVGSGGIDFGAFASGVDFTVGGNGGTDTQRVSFLATPGEKVSVMPEIASRGRSSSSDSAPAKGGDININMPISGVHSDSFRANKHQYTGDILRALSAGRRYA